MILCILITKNINISQVLSIQLGVDSKLSGLQLPPTSLAHPKPMKIYENH